MNTDLILAVIGSLALHAGVAFGDRLLPVDAPTPAKTEESAPTIEVALPPVEPDKPDASDEPADASATPASAADLAPPSLADTPTATIDSPFVQQLEAPRPSGPSLAGTAITIPVAGAGAPGLRNAAAALFDLASLDQAPVALAQLPPEYPASLRRRGVSGEVVIRFVVDSQGRVRNAVVVRSAEAGFEQAALDAVSRWRFKPGRKGGSAVNTRMEIPLEFNLR